MEVLWIPSSAEPGILVEVLRVCTGKLLEYAVADRFYNLSERRSCTH